MLCPLCLRLVQSVVPHAVWTCAVILAFKIACYVLCRLKGSCYQSVPHWEVSHLAGVFSALLKVPNIPSPFWMQEAGLCAQRCLLWLVSLLFVSRQFIMPTLQQEHRQEILLSIGTQGSWPLSLEQRELQQVVFSEATQTTLFFLAKIYPYFLWFRSGAVTHTLAERMLFQKQTLFFLILLQHENLKFWTVYFEVEKSKFLVLLCYIVIEI